MARPSGRFSQPSSASPDPALLSAADSVRAGSTNNGDHDNEASVGAAGGVDVADRQWHSTVAHKGVVDAHERRDQYIGGPRGGKAIAEPLVYIAHPAVVEQVAKIRVPAAGIEVSDCDRWQSCAEVPCTSSTASIPGWSPMTSVSVESRLAAASSIRSLP